MGKPGNYMTISSGSWASLGPAETLPFTWEPIPPINPVTSGRAGVDWGLVQVT